MLTFRTLNHQQPEAGPGWCSEMFTHEDTTWSALPAEEDPAIDTRKTSSYPSDVSNHRANQPSAQLGVSLGSLDEHTDATGPQPCTIANASAVWETLPLSSLLGKTNDLVTFSCDTDANTIWKSTTLPEPDDGSLSNNPTLIVLNMAEDWMVPQEKTPAAFMYVSPIRTRLLSTDNTEHRHTSTSEVGTAGRRHHVGIINSSHDTDQIVVERTILALEIASAVVDDLTSRNHYTWLLSRTAPSGVEGSITNQDEASMVTEQLLQAAVNRFREGADEGYTTYKDAVVSHLGKYLHFADANFILHQREPMGVGR